MFEEQQKLGDKEDPYYRGRGKSMTKYNIVLRSAGPCGQNERYIYNRK